jgi:release factor glutamine methyltransferase
MKESDFFKYFVQKAREELEFLPDKPEEDPESTIASLWCKASGTAVSVERANKIALPSLDESQQKTLHDLYEKRRSGIPVQHITGRQFYVDIELLSGPEALIR